MPPRPRPGVPGTGLGIGFLEYPEIGLLVICLVFHVAGVFLRLVKSFGEDTG